MKNIRSLIMLLIGMISFTTLATTPVLEQKQKALTTVVDVVQPVYADVVQDVITVQVAILSEYNNSRSFTNKDYPKTNYFAVVTDVGWCFVGDVGLNNVQDKDVEKVVVELTLKAAAAKDNDYNRSAVVVRCLKSATLAAYPNNLYINACATYNGHTYFTHLVYTNGQLSSTEVVEVSSCSCVFD